ncbi:hypothetical protein B4N89_44540 [Embleya scabrispora]|uniref:Uncharacterized protein n=1 Tax=Embleya scabrispora TaxID=159449 RepID=A0A1T3NL09_9ACTN|nr:hypothetical protein [Embleya scabrispora]OPC77559.1 hypothetical protein B4N89_44540 [Embleya scabrispora]
MSEYAAVPAWPVILIELGPNDTVEIGGVPVPVDPGRNPRDVALAVAAETAGVLGRAVRVQAVEPDGTTFPLIVDSEGNVVQAGDPTPVKPARRGLGLRRGRTGAAAGPNHPRAGAASAPGIRPTPPRAPEHEPPAFPGLSGGAEPLRSPVDPPPAPTPAVFTPPPAPVGDADASPVPPTKDAEDAWPYEGVRRDVVESSYMPTPTPEQQRALGVIARALDQGEPDRALIVAKTMARAASASGDIGAAVATRELYAYLALLADRADLAARLYDEAVALFDPGLVDPSGWRDRLAENARWCRSRAALDRVTRA